jgi:hypothetical protein
MQEVYDMLGKFNQKGDIKKKIMKCERLRLKIRQLRRRI